MLAELQGKIQTVKGPIDPDDLGATLIHEHLFFDLYCYYQDPEDDRGKKLSEEPIELSNLAWVRQNSMNSKPNLVVLDEDVAVSEVERYVELGGRAIVDQSVNGIARMPHELVNVSNRTGAHIVIGSGYYVFPSHPPDMGEKTVEGLIQEIRTDLETGIDGTEVRSGLIGEIGASTPLHADEEKCLRAAAQAQKETGAPFSIHPGHDPRAPKEHVDLVKEEGADPNRVIMSHVDNRFRDNLDLYKELADTGCHLSFDCFGRSLYFAGLRRQHPSDDDRVNAIAGLIRDGYLNQIMVAQDCCFRIDLTTWGGHGYGYILDHMVPRLEAAGVGERELHQILVENPKRFLTFGS